MQPRSNGPLSAYQERTWSFAFLAAKSVIEALIHIRDILDEGGNIVWRNCQDVGGGRPGDVTEHVENGPVAGFIRTPRPTG